MAFMGMRGNGDWVTDQRPMNWRETILFLYPNGRAPLTAMLSKMKSEKTDDPQFHWWTKTLAEQAGAVTGIYTNTNLTTALAAAGTSGQTLYIKMAEATAEEIREGHQVLLRDTSDYTVDVNAKVTSVVKNGASSYAACKLLEADDNSTTHTLVDCDRILVIGNINAEGATMPDAIAYDPTKWYNYTQIFRTPLSITRTARRTRLRTGDQYREAKREALEMHSTEIEKALFWGIRTENTGSNGKPERTTWGVIDAIKQGAAANCSDFQIDGDFAGKKWLDFDGGRKWLNTMLEKIFRYGDTEKLIYCGSGALMGINEMAESLGQINLSIGAESYGIKVTKWLTPFGTVNFVTHPLFSYEVTNRYSAVIIEPNKFIYRYIDDTSFYAEGEKQNTGYTRKDGTDEEFLTECGLEYHHPTAFGYLNGIGLDNDLA
jgi:hypothetical protein